MAAQLPRMRLDPGFKLLNAVGAPGLRRVIILTETREEIW